MDEVIFEYMADKQDFDDAETNKFKVIDVGGTKIYKTGIPEIDEIEREIAGL